MHPHCLSVNCIYQLWNSELWNGWDGTERCQSWATMDIVVFMQTPSSGQMYLIPSCWEYQTLPAHSSVHQWLIPLGTVDCFVQVSTPFPGSNPQLTTGYWEDTKTQFPCFNLGQLQRSLSDLFKLHRARCQLQSHCRSAAPSAQSCLPAFLTRVPPEHSSINLLQAVLCFRVCLQRTQYKTVSISTNEQWSGVITGWLTPIVPQDSWPLKWVPTAWLHLYQDFLQQ